MKRLTLALSLALLACAALAKDATSDFKKFMAGMMPKIEKAFMAGDLKFFNSVSTDDFTEKDNGQTMSKAQAMEQMKQGFAMGKVTSCKLKLDSAKVNGNTAIAMTSGKMVMNQKGMTPHAKPVTMTIQMWQKETWVKSGNGWKIKAIEQAKPMKVSQSGGH